MLTSSSPAVIFAVKLGSVRSHRCIHITAIKNVTSSSMDRLNPFITPPAEVISWWEVFSTAKMVKLVTDDNYTETICRRRPVTLLSFCTKHVPVCCLQVTLKQTEGKGVSFFNLYKKDDFAAPIKKVVKSRGGLLVEREGIAMRGMCSNWP